MPGRKYNYGNSYQYGFGGKRKDNEIYGEGNSYDFDNRFYDSRLVHWLSLDKLQAKRPGESPYLYCGGSPIAFADPDGRDRIIRTKLIRQFADGSYVTITKTQVLKGLDTYQKVQQYDAHGKPTGNYEYHDIYESHTTILNSKGENVGSSASYLTGNEVQFVSGNDLDSKWGRFVESVDDRTPRKEGHRKGGGGIAFTSIYGQGGGPTADFTDAQMENLDNIMDVASAVGSIANLEVFGREVGKAFALKGTEKKFAIAELFIKLAKSVVEDKINEAKTEIPKKQKGILEKGSDSCEACHKVEPAGTMNKNIDKSENYHPDKYIIKTKGSNKVE